MVNRIRRWRESRKANSPRKEKEPKSRKNVMQKLASHIRNFTRSSKPFEEFYFKEIGDTRHDITNAINKSSWGKTTKGESVIAKITEELGTARDKYIAADKAIWLPEAFKNSEHLKPVKELLLPRDMSIVPQPLYDDCSRLYNLKYKSRRDKLIKKLSECFTIRADISNKYYNLRFKFEKDKNSVTQKEMTFMSKLDEFITSKNEIYHKHRESTDQQERNRLVKDMNNLDRDVARHIKAISKVGVDKYIEKIKPERAQPIDPSSQNGPRM